MTWINEIPTVPIYYQANPHNEIPIVPIYAHERINEIPAVLVLFSETTAKGCLIDLCERHFQVESLAGSAQLEMITQMPKVELDDFHDVLLRVLSPKLYMGKIQVVTWVTFLG